MSILFFCVSLFGVDEFGECVSAVVAYVLGVAATEADSSYPAEDGGFGEGSDEWVVDFCVAEVAECEASAFVGWVVGWSGVEVFSHAGTADVGVGASVSSDASASFAVSGFFASAASGAFDAVAADAVGFRRHTRIMGL